MSRTRKSSGSPATSPEAQEQRLVSLAVKQVEKQLEEGTASTSVILHYLKLGTTREQLEQERLRKENLMLEAKTASLETAARSEDLFREAIRAFTSYRTDTGDDDV